MCGIVGIAGRGANIVPRLVSSLKRLEYRGYDSAGFAIVECDSGRLLVFKDAGKIDDVVERYNIKSYCGISGIAHTRWATHGAPNRINAHPHTDCTGTIAVVHNGIIKNYAELRRELEALGHTFHSETDTEVIPHLLEELVVKKKHSLLEALRVLVTRLEGSYAVVILYTKEPNRIYFIKNISPLVLGLGEGENYVSSDIPSFLRYTRRVVVVEDGEIGYVTPVEVYLEKRGKPIDIAKRLQTIRWSAKDAEKAGYPHFMLKEIMEQPRALKETYMGIQSDDNLVMAANLLHNSAKVFVTGAGTSYHAALVYSYFSMKLAKKVAMPFIASEYESYIDTVDENSVLIAISQSGETIDTLQALRAFKRRGAKIIAISNVIDSAIPRESDIKIYMRAGPEIGVAATKTYLTQILVLQALAIKHAEVAGTIDASTAAHLLDKLSQSSRAAHEGIEKTAWHVEKLARVLKTRKNMYILGRGLGSLLSYEAALKVKEVSYIHAEAYPAGESKHGPIALVEQGYPVLFIGTPPRELVEKLEGNIMEMRARGALTILVAVSLYKQLENKVDMLLDVGDYDELLAPYALMPPLQLLAYRLAVLLGYDPDKPRNLAKTVTVE